jgi:hypothetical protein
VNPIVVPVGVNDDDVNVKLVVDDNIRELIPFPILGPNRISIRLNVNDPAFDIPDPLLPNELPTFIIATDVVELVILIVRLSKTYPRITPPFSLIVALQLLILTFLILNLCVDVGDDE